MLKEERDSVILLLSRCIGKFKDNKTPYSYITFHFNGYLNGKKIKKIMMIDNENFENIIIGEDYLIWSQIISLEGSLLTIKGLKIKNVT